MRRRAAGSLTLALLAPSGCGAPSGRGRTGESSLRYVLNSGERFVPAVVTGHTAADAAPKPRS